MKKSPFSTPRGYGGHRRYSHNKFNNSYENKTHYNKNKNDFFTNLTPKTTSETVQSDDFIPFDTSSPSSSSFHQKRQSGNCFTPRCRRNNYSFDSQGSFNDSMSPKIYVDTSPSDYFHRTPKARGSNFRKTPIDEIPMSEFLNMESVLEDPWKELMELYEKKEASTSKLDGTAKTSISNEFNDFSINENASANSSKCSEELKSEEKNAISSSEILESKKIVNTLND